MRDMEYFFSDSDVLMSQCVNDKNALGVYFFLDYASIALFLALPIYLADPVNHSFYEV